MPFQFLTSSQMLAHDVESGGNTDLALRLYTGALPGSTAWIAPPPVKSPSSAIPSTDGAITHDFAYDPPATIGVGGTDEFGAVNAGTENPVALSWGVRLLDGYFDGGGYDIPVLGSYQEEGIVTIFWGGDIYLGNDADGEHGGIRIDVGTGEVYYRQLESGSTVEKKFDVVVPRWRGGVPEPFYYHLAKTTVNAGADSQVTLTVISSTTEVSTPLVFTAPGTPAGSGSFQLGRTVAGDVPAWTISWWRAGWAAGTPGGFGSSAVSSPVIFASETYNANGTTGSFIDSGTDDEYWHNMQFGTRPNQRWGAELYVRWVASNTAPSAGTLASSTWSAATWTKVPANGVLFFYDSGYVQGRYLSLQWRFDPPTGYVDLDGWRPHVVSNAGVVALVAHQSTEPAAPSGDPPAIPKTLNVNEGTASLTLPVAPRFPYSYTDARRSRTATQQHGLTRSHAASSSTRRTFTLAWDVLTTSEKSTLIAFLVARQVADEPFLVTQPDGTTIGVSLLTDEFSAKQDSPSTWRVSPVEVREVFA